MNENSQDWTDCPPGEIGGLVDRLKTARRQQTYKQAAAVTSAVVVFALAATILISGWLGGNSAIPAIACEKVWELAPLYVQGQTNADVSAQIEHHLIGCQHCRGYFRQNYPNFPLPQQAARSMKAAPIAFAWVSDSP